MYYGELITDDGIQERGVFLSLGEFVPYRAAGWTCETLDAEADRRLEWIRENPANCNCNARAAFQGRSGQGQPIDACACVILRVQAAKPLTAIHAVPKRGAL